MRPAKGFQTLQALYAIGSGGIFGKGLGQSIQKLGFLPEQQNDMIFSIICEELGLFGGIAVILIFLLLIWRLMIIANNASDLFGALLVVGVLGHIAIQVILNVAVVTNSMPNTGVSLAVYQLRRLIDPVFADRDGARHERCPRHQGPGCVMGYARIARSSGAKKTSVLSGHGAAVQLHLSRMRHLCHSIG